MDKLHITCYDQSNNRPQTRRTDMKTTAPSGDSPRPTVTRKASARKSMDEFKPIMVTEIFRGRMAVDGRPIIEKRTEVIGTSYDSANPDGTTKLGKFGKFRGLTFSNRQDAVDHAAAYILDLERKEAEWAAKRKRA